MSRRWERGFDTALLLTVVAGHLAVSDGVADRAELTLELTLCHLRGVGDPAEVVAGVDRTGNAEAYTAGVAVPGDGGGAQRHRADG